MFHIWFGFYTATFSMTVTVPLEHDIPLTKLQLAGGDGIFDLCYSVSAVHYLASASLTKTAEQRIGQLTSSLQRVLGTSARPCTLQAYLILVLKVHHYMLLLSFVVFCCLLLLLLLLGVYRCYVSLAYACVGVTLGSFVVDAGAWTFNGLKPDL